jgi:hypothetical protein
MNSRILQSIEMLNEDTVQIVFKGEITVTLEDIKQAYEDYDAYAGGRRLKRLVISGKNTEITKDARRYGEQENEKRKDNCIAEAMVVYTFVQKMVTNFYLKYIKDLYPTKSFTNIEEAREWLLNYREDPKQARK